MRPLLPKHRHVAPPLLCGMAWGVFLRMWRGEGGRREGEEGEEGEEGKD